jgi:hypothetical protein
MRCSFDGLSMLAEPVIQCNPFSSLLSKVICLAERQGKLPLLGIVYFDQYQGAKLIRPYIVLAVSLPLQARALLA